jgi:hypothetical protein
VAEVLALEFTPPRADAEFDFEEILARAASSSVNKRIFIEFAIADVADHIGRAQLLARAGVVLTARGPFDDVPWHDYFRVMLAAAEQLAGPERLCAGQRELGRSVYPRLIDTEIGRLMLGRQMAEAIRQAGDVWAQFNTVGRVRVEAESEREAYLHFEDYPAALTETVSVGIFEGLFRHHHADGEIALARISATHTIVRLRW